MSTAEETANKAMVARFEDALSSGNWEVISTTIDELVLPDALIRSPIPTESEGTQKLKEIFAALNHAYPDLQVAVDDVIAEGDRVVTRNTCTGTHQGEYMGIPPTGRSVTYNEIFIFRVADGRIVETWGVVDVLSQMKQIGAIPAYQEHRSNDRICTPSNNQTQRRKTMEARLNLFDNPVAMKFGKYINSAGRVITESTLPTATQELVKLRASQINGCGFCTDMHTKDAAAAGESQLRLNLVAAWREATVFTEAERAALAVTEQGTRIADAAEGVADEVWANAAKHYDEGQLGALVALIALINTYNRLNVITRQPAGDYQPGQWD